MNPGLHRHFVRLDCLQRNGRESGSMIMAGGANNTTYPNGERGFICQPAAQIPFLVFGGLGGTISHAPPRNANTVPAFPPFPHKRATARHDLWRPRYPHLNEQRGRHRMRWPCDAMRNDFGQTRPARARPTWPPGSAPKKNGTHRNGWPLRTSYI